MKVTTCTYAFYFTIAASISQMLVNVGAQTPQAALGTVQKLTTTFIESNLQDTCVSYGLQINGVTVVRMCDNSIFLGNLAGGGNNTKDNAYIGYKAGEQNTSGRYNVALGHSAGFQSKGSNNTFIGSASGKSLRTGGRNTALGDDADIRDEVEFATAIGANSVANESNQIVLGTSRERVDIPGYLRLKNLNAVGTSGDAQQLCIQTSGSYVNIVSLCRPSIPRGTPSSARYKINVRTFDQGLSLLNRLKPVSFDWKDGKLPDIGLIAEDVAEVDPTLTYKNENGKVEGINYNGIQIVAINAIKELRSELESQRNENQTLSKTVQSQQAQLDSQKKMLEQMRLSICSQSKETDFCNLNGN